MKTLRYSLALFAIVALPVFGNTADSQTPNAAAETSELQEQAKTISQAAPIDTAMVKEVQEALNQKGFGVGKADGVLGAKTAAAVSKFQQAQGLDATGAIDQQTIVALGVKVPGDTTGASPINSGAPMQPEGSLTPDSQTAPVTETPSE